MTEIYIDSLMLFAVVCLSKIDGVEAVCCWLPLARFFRVRVECFFFVFVVIFEGLLF